MSDDVVSRQQEEVALAHLEDRAAVEWAPHREPTTPGEWIRENLFSSPFNSVLTVLAAAFAGFFGFRLLHWVFVTAEWGVLKTNVSSYMLGRFPREEAWRVWIGLDLVVALAGFSWGALGKRVAWTTHRVVLMAIGGVAGVLLLLYLLDGVRIWLLIGLAIALFLGGIAVGRATSGRARRTVAIGWIVVYPLVVLVLVGFGGPPPRLWGGVLLNVMVGSIGIVASFPLGVLLALGRRSSFPAIRTFCVGVIELIRGVPLITLLISGVFILPLLLPPALDLPPIIRIVVMFTIFSSVYVAEIVRGGLQGVHQGQYEAAKAVGLSTTRMTALVILPQALRNTIPAMISHFISVWKDTSLLAIVSGFVDLLRTARRAGHALEFIGHHREALIAAAVIFWAVAISLGRWSQRVERRVGVGER